MYYDPDAAINELLQEIARLEAALARVRALVDDGIAELPAHLIERKIRAAIDGP